MKTSRFFFAFLLIIVTQQQQHLLLALNRQLPFSCPDDIDFASVAIDYEAYTARNIRTIQNVVGCDVDGPDGRFNVPSSITMNIVSVDPGAQFAVYSHPPGLAVASISPSGVLELFFGREMMVADTHKAGLVIEVPEDHAVENVEVAGAADVVQMDGVFPFLGSLAIAGGFTEVQADFTGASVVNVAITGVAKSTKIRSTSNFHLEVTGVGVTLEADSDIQTALITGTMNDVLIQGNIVNAQITGAYNALRVNDETGVGCSTTSSVGFGNACTEVTDKVIFDTLPCTSTARNVVMEVRHTPNFEGCWFSSGVAPTVAPNTAAPSSPATVPPTPAQPTTTAPSSTPSASPSTVSPTGSQSSSFIRSGGVESGASRLMNLLWLAAAFPVLIR